MSEPIRIGLAGFGMAATIMHVPFLLANPGYEIVTVFERTADEAKKQLPNARIVRTIEELVEDPGVELVVITTPNDTHFHYAEKAILAGKHVLVEKPFTNTINEATILIDLAKRKKVLLSVYQNRRYVADFLTVQQIMRERLLGDMVEYEAHFDRYRPALNTKSWKEEPKPGSGLLYDLGSHLIDQALVLFGLPRAISAEVCIKREQAKTDDYFDIDLHYPHFKATLKSSLLVREPGPRFMLHGTRGSFIKYGEDPQEALLKQGVQPITADWGLDPEEQWGILHTEIDGVVSRKTYPSLQGSFGKFYENLQESIRNGAPLSEKPEHGYNTIRLVELALISNKKKATIECKGFLAI